MPNFDNLTPPTSAFIDENNDIQDIQSVLESGAVVVTSVAPGPVTPIGVATTPKFENIAPWAGKFVNSSNEIIELIEFLTSGAISVQITGTHGDAPVTGSYITKIDETALMTNSIPLSGLPSGFLSSTTVSGDLITRIFSGTANQVSILNGDGSAAPVWSLPNVLIAPGTFRATTSINIGGAGATITTISTDSTLSNDSDSEVSTQKAVKAYVDASAGATAGSTYITQIDETGDLPNSTPLSTKPSGFLSSVNLSGIVTNRTLSGTANQVSVLNGNGASGNPVFSLSTSLIFPGTATLGGTLDAKNHAIVSNSFPLNLGSPTAVVIQAPILSCLAIGSSLDSTNRIDFTPFGQSFIIDSVQRMITTSSGLKLETGATVNNIDNTGSSVLATDLVTAFAMQSAISDSIDSGVSFRDAWDASVNLYPSTGGSGVGGAIETGNWWYISVAGTLGANPVENGDRIYAIADTPGQSDSNWLVVISKVDSVFGRTGPVLAESGDYSFPQITGLPAAATSGSVMQGNGSLWQEATIAQGTGISIANISGTITFTNSSPDQTVVLNNGTSISVTGTYPNFTVNNTDPDQTVVLNSGVGISVTGTYPNFTIDNTGTSGSFVSVTTATQALAVNTTYYTTFAGLSVMTLPVTASVGETIRVMAGPSGNTFKIDQNSGQQIFYGALLGVSQSTTVGVGGDLSSTEPNTSVLLMCVVADTQWQVISNVNQLDGV